MWWIPIEFIWWYNPLIFVDIIVSSRVCDETTSWSFHFHWDEEVLWLLNSQLHVWVIRFIAYLDPKLSALVGFISYFSILFPNNKPWPNSSITTSPESSVKVLTPVQIGIFTCSIYYGSNGDTLHSSKVNDIGQKFSPKQWLSELLSISVADSLQITLSFFLFTLLINRRSLVLMFNTVIFTFSSGTICASYDIVTRFPRPF